MIIRITYDLSMWFLQQQGLTMKFRRVAKSNEKGPLHLGRGGFEILLINNSKGGNPYLTLSFWQRNYFVWVEVLLPHYRVIQFKLFKIRICIFQETFMVGDWYMSSQRTLVLDIAPTLPRICAEV